MQIPGHLDLSFTLLSLLDINFGKILYIERSLKLTSEGSKILEFFKKKQQNKTEIVRVYHF